MEGEDTHSRSHSVDLAAAAEAAARRLQSPPGKAPNPKEQYAAEREKRQHFRRLIDPGIVRPNSKEVTSLVLQTLAKLAENLLREPDNPRYQSFKPTNDAIKKRLVDPPGALEYAIEMGFRAEVQDFQPYYIFNPKFMDNLRIGADIIREAVKTDQEKNERMARAKKEEKAAADAVKRNIALAYMDDRKTQELRDERERIVREARAAAQAQAMQAAKAQDNRAESPEVPGTVPKMPGTGKRLTGDVPAMALTPDDLAADPDADTAEER